MPHMITNFSGKQWTEGRSATKYTYTVDDIARLTGLKRKTIWNYTTQGKLIPSSLESVVHFISYYQNKDLNRRLNS